MTTFTGTNGDDDIDGTAGDDTINGLGGNDFLRGGDGGDTINGGDGNDIIFENFGLDPDTHADTLSGGDGNDTIGAGLGDFADGGNGTDTLTLRLDHATSALTNIDLTNLWAGGVYSFFGATVERFENINWFAATGFDDIITLGTPMGKTGTLSGNDGDDTLTGGVGNDILWAGLNGLSTSAESYTDVMHGGDGDDQMAGGIGDTFDGGTGTDVVTFDMSTYGSGVNVTLGVLAIDHSDTILGTTFIDVDHVKAAYGTDFDDVINLTGDNYGTRIEGHGGDDDLTGSFGADTIIGGTGADTMAGGSGNDTYDVDNSGDAVFEYASEGNDTVDSTVSYTLGDNVEQLNLFGTAAINGTGNDLDNFLGGNSAHNVLTGGLGKDTMFGGGGDDLLKGGDAGDQMHGGDGDDTLQGSTGSDTEYGEAGRDVLSGGPGLDRFMFDDNDFSGTTAATADEITDFHQVQGDVINLKSVDAVVGGTDNAFTFIGTGAFTGVAGQLNYSFDGTFTLVQGDTNGDGIADFAIALDGNVALVAADFVL